MREQTLERLGEAFYDIDNYNDLTEIDMLYLLDDLVDVLEDLHNKEITEGRFYEEYIHLVEPGGEIPKPYSNITLKGFLSDEAFTIHVKLINSIEWGNDGNLLVRFLGKKIRK